MKLQIGRVGLDVEMAAPRDASVGASVDVEAMELAGYLRDTDPGDAAVLREQLLGHVGDVVPVRIGHDPALDGVYELLAVSVEMPRGQWVARSLPFSVTLRPLRRRATPLVEVLVTGALRPNEHSIVAGDTRLIAAVPPGMARWSRGKDGVDRETEDGVVAIQVQAPSVSTRMDSTYTMGPADWYRGSARVEVDGVTRTGTQAPDTPDDWLIGNGMVELRPSGTAGRDFEVRCWTPGSPAAWGAWVPLRIGAWNSGLGQVDSIGDREAPQILHSSPESVALRVSWPDATGYVESVFSLRRGSRLVTVHLVKRLASLTLNMAVQSMQTGGTDPNWTDGTSHGYRTGNDPNGHRMVVFSTRSNVVNAGTRSIRNDGSPPPSVTYGIGFEVAGTSAQTGDQIAQLTQQFFARQSVRMEAT